MECTRQRNSPQTWPTHAMASKNPLPFCLAWQTLHQASLAQSNPKHLLLLIKPIFSALNASSTFCHLISDQCEAKASSKSKFTASQAVTLLAPILATLVTCRPHASVLRRNGKLLGNCLTNPKGVSNLMPERWSQQLSETFFDAASDRLAKNRFK